MFFSNKEKVNIALDSKKPFIVLNFKTYKESEGDNALRLAEICAKVQKKTGLNIIVCVQAIDLKDVSEAVHIPVFAQHVDNNAVGKSTGSILPEELVDINIHGTLLNHSEKRLEFKDVKSTVLKLKELNMTSIVCAKNDAEVKKFASIKPVRPDFIAVEPPELIGGEVSVSSSKPDIIKKSVQLSSGANLLVGAGIKDNNDVKLALNYGAKGVLLASHFVFSKNPEKFLFDLVNGLY